MTTDTTFEPDTAYQLPPGTLLLQRNIRESKPSQDLVHSVAELGVLEPITAVLNDDGDLVVRFGHRRVLAAIEAGLDTVPVYVAGVENTSSAGEVDRIIRQRDENTHRSGLTTAEEVGVVEQLVAFGLSADEIAKQARIHKDRVHTAIKVTSSEIAAKAAAKWDELTLEQVAAVAEFEADPDAVKALVQSAHDGRFEHTVQRMRDDRQRAQERDAAIAKLKADKVSVLKEAPSYNAKVQRLDNLVDIKTGKNLTTANHKKCPGHVAWIAPWGKPEPVYGCSDPAKNGHRDRYGTSKPAAANMSEKEREQAKEERRLVIENNRAWASAETVRRGWLAIFAKMKTPPKGAGAFLAVATSLDSSQFTYSTEPGKLTAEWLGLTAKEHGRFDLTSAVENATDARALHIALLHNLAVYEAELTKGAWREDGTTSRAGRYLRFLASCGYPLSDVEQFAISKKTV